jgi:hypothetical protein
MKNYLVEIYAIEWCGFFETYEVLAEGEDDAEDKALEIHLEDFVDMYDLILTEHGYLESDDIEEDGSYEEEECTTIGTKVVI